MLFVGNNSKSSDSSSSNNNTLKHGHKADVG